MHRVSHNVKKVANRYGVTIHDRCSAKDGDEKEHSARPVHSVFVSVFSAASIMNAFQLAQLSILQQK